MQLETKFLHLRTPVTIGSRFGDWEVTWLGGWTRDRLSYLVMAVKIERRSASARSKRQFRDGSGASRQRLSLAHREKRTNMDELYEATEPEPTDEEIEAAYVDHLLQIAPPITWGCYCEYNNERHVCREEPLAMLPNDPMC